MEAEIKKSYGEKDQEHLWHALKPLSSTGSSAYC